MESLFGILPRSGPLSYCEQKNPLRSTVLSPRDHELFFTVYPKGILQTNLFEHLFLRQIYLLMHRSIHFMINNYSFYEESKN